MRCKLCNHENEDGASFCLTCGTALTKYGAQITGEVSDETLRKKARLSVRPSIIPTMAGVVAGTAALGPARLILSSILSHEKVNAESTNYLSSAFNAAGTALTAFVVVPIILAMAVVVWGIMTQREWSWGGAIVVLGIILFLGGMLPLFLGHIVVRVVAVAVLGYMWTRPEVKEWYGQ